MPYCSSSRMNILFNDRIPLLLHSMVPDQCRSLPSNVSMENFRAATASRSQQGIHRFPAPCFTAQHKTIDTALFATARQKILPFAVQTAKNNIGSMTTQHHRRSNRMGGGEGASEIFLWSDGIRFGRTQQKKSTPSILVTLALLCFPRFFFLISAPRKLDVRKQTDASNARGQNNKEGQQHHMQRRVYSVSGHEMRSSTHDVRPVLAIGLQS